MNYGRHSVFIGGQWRSVSTDAAIDVVNPSTGQVVGHIPRGGQADIDDAVAAAQKAFDTIWGRMAAAERGRHLTRFFAEIERHAETLVTLESIDVGKPISLARREVATLARYFEFYAGAADKMHGETIPYGEGDVVLLLREPIGVAGVVLPWNGPAVMFGRTVAAALAAGNCCVVKPAEDASLSVLFLAELAEKSGLPAGVLNVVTGYGHKVGTALAAHLGIGHLSFTGSPEVGTLCQQAAARNHVPVTLELGGNSPNIVFSDADLEAAATAITIGITINAGQVCAAGSRVLVQRACYDRLLDRLGERFVRLRAGDAQEDLDLGPLISRKQLDRVQGYVECARRDRIKVFAEG
jgi:aldehyde dehydrogenase (NAD+)